VQGEAPALIYYRMFYIVLSFYLLFACLTCLNQLSIPRLQRALARIDIFRLLPVWTFFAPNPGVSDYHLVYRCRDKNGNISPFKKVSLRNKKNIANAIWNPGKRSQKALNDFVQDIRRMISDNDMDETNEHLLKLSFSYIVTLHYCTELVKQTFEEASVQFMILESFGYFELRKPRLILNSEFHRI